MNLELKKKIGQLLIAGFPSPELDDQARALVNDFYVGNFAFFGRNIVTPAQTSKLCSDLTNMVYEKTGFAPFICADQEGGVVTRVNLGASLMPGTMSVNASGTDKAYQLGANNGRVIRALGLSCTFAPILEVNLEPMNPIIGSRSFGDDHEVVAKLGVPMALGFQSSNILPSVKHFPGHGNVATDSHLDVPFNDTPRAVLEETEWQPFYKAFAQGVDGLMTCHVVYNDVDPEWPATLSYEIMTKLLREKMGFDGLALTDCMEMDAIRAHYGIGEGAVRALEAGCDLLTFSHTYDAVSKAANALYEAVDSGRLSIERIEESYQRVLRYKEKYGLMSDRVLSIEEARNEAYDPAKLELNRQVSLDSMTLISGNIDALLNAKKPAFFAPASIALTGAEDVERKPNYFSDRAVERFGGTSCVIPMNELDEATKEAINGDYDVAVLGLYNCRFRKGQQEVLRALEATDRPLIVVLLGAPYDKDFVKRCDGLVCAYEYTELATATTIEALANNRFPGKLPIKN
ncbi:MAG: hypothetical protein IKT58_06795 [Oscillospiraceae bacterium]|nr:hypothetical protein [Oscillospiraceae bacterium]